MLLLNTHSSERVLRTLLKKFQVYRKNFETHNKCEIANVVEAVKDEAPRHKSMIFGIFCVFEKSKFYWIILSYSIMID
jgi:hypothetical protein